MSKLEEGFEDLKVAIMKMRQLHRESPELDDAQSFHQIVCDFLDIDPSTDDEEQLIRIEETKKVMRELGKSL